MYTSNLLDPLHVITHYVYIAKHNYNNVDSWLPFISDIVGHYIGIGRQYQMFELMRFNPEKLYRM
jgi:hypothetical protein